MSLELLSPLDATTALTAAQDQTQHAKLLWLFLGNPARGDDGAGYCLYQALSAEPATWCKSNNVDAAWYFQLCPEQVFDLQDRTAVVFIDADARFSQGIRFEQVRAAEQPVVNSHSLAPQTLLGLFQQVFQTPPPTAWLLSIGCQGFELGAALSATTQHNMAQAQHCLSAWLVHQQ
jgi:hydrogenase maturation protease